ncbi:hypothetical protein AGLY_009462 [Aphis glycines]|uniref:Uncharacterized protein n=1 Tax=Aphis glycines TaxID=307491 RepID=A0A6G0TJP6_APHGL|nr:hypothetical protein AGLY_009462 [Aphis glycines]
MYSYNFLITIRITYEELCIKFSSILIGPKKFYRHFKKKISEKLKISVYLYDLYFLNNNKYLKSFQDNSLSLRDFLKILNSNALKIFPIMMLRLLEDKPLENLVLTTHKEPCIKFSKLFGHPKIFHRHFKKNFSKKSKNFSGYSLFHRKPSPKFEIEVLFRLVMLYTDTKKKKTSLF